MAIYRNYEIRKTKTGFSIFPPHSDWVSVASGITTEGAAKLRVDTIIQHIEQQNVIAAERDGYTD